MLRDEQGFEVVLIGDLGSPRYLPANLNRV
jgi:hypothetical protein